jgi:hypothetical protein
MKEKGGVALLLWCGMQAALCLAGPPESQDEAAIAKALSERLGAALEFSWEYLSLVDHREVRVQVDAGRRQAQMLWMGNKVLPLKARFFDLEAERISIADNFIELSGSGPDKLFIDRARSEAYVLDRRDGSRIRYAAVAIQEKGRALRIRFDDACPIALALSGRKKRAELFLGTAYLASMKIALLSMEGAQSGNLVVLQGDGPRPIRYNRSRGILFFPEGKGSMPGTTGVFAAVRRGTGP